MKRSGSQAIWSIGILVLAAGLLAGCPKRPEVRDALAALGHAVVTLGDLEGPCSVEIIRRDPATGVLQAGSDPRRDGWALAY